MLRVACYRNGVIHHKGTKDRKNGDLTPNPLSVTEKGLCDIPTPHSTTFHVGLPMRHPLQGLYEARTYPP
jgi:hypothetical protein